MSRNRKCILHLTFDRNRREGGSWAVLCVFNYIHFCLNSEDFFPLKSQGEGCVATSWIRQGEASCTSSPLPSSCLWVQTIAYRNFPFPFNSLFLSGGIMLERSTLAWRPFGILPQLKDGELMNCCRKCFDSNQNWPEFCYPSNSFTVPIFISRKEFQTVNKFGLLTVRANFWLKDEDWLNCCPRCFDSNHNLPEFWYAVAAIPLIHFTFVLSGERIL